MAEVTWAWEKGRRRAGTLHTFHSNVHLQACAFQFDDVMIRGIGGNANHRITLLDLCVQEFHG